MRKKQIIIASIVGGLALVSALSLRWVYVNVYKDDLISRYRINYPAKGIKIACVGDSNTQGGDIGDEMNRYSYPSRLAELLGNRYSVANFGVNGATASTNIGQTYFDKNGYAYSKQFNPDIVIINFGTNDSKIDNWDRHKFNSEYRQLIQSYLNLPNKPRVIVCSPIYAFSTAWNIQPEVIAQQIVPDVQTICRELDVEFIDLNQIFEEKEVLYLNDGIHLTHDGYEELAKTIYQSIEWPKG